MSVENIPQLPPGGMGVGDGENAQQQQRLYDRTIELNQQSLYLANTLGPQVAAEIGHQAVNTNTEETHTPQAAPADTVLPVDTVTYASAFYQG